MCPVRVTVPGVTPERPTAVWGNRYIALRRYADQRINQGIPDVTARAAATVVGEYFELLSGWYAGFADPWACASPDDVVVFMEDWVRRHGRTAHADGETISSFSYAKAALSYVPAGSLREAGVQREVGSISSRHKPLSQQVGKTVEERV